MIRGLYGDIAEKLHEPDECTELWAQVEPEHLRLRELMAPRPLR